MALTSELCRLILVLLCLVSADVRYAESAICEPIRIPMCHWLPYNLTRMPNLLFHSAQRNAQLVIEQYQPLVETNCSADLLFFLCAMFAPMCPMGFRQDVIPPCRGVCVSARLGCEPVLRRYNVSWPAALDCDQLPFYDRGVCISPESIVATPHFGQVSGDSSRHSDPGIPRTVKIPRCERKSINKIKLKTMFRGGRFSFAMTAIYNRAELLPEGMLVLHLTPRLIFYHRRVKVSRGLAKVYLPEGCLPIRVRPGKSYLLMGHEDRQNRRLLLASDSYVDIWRPKTLKRLKKWNQKLAKAKYKKRRATAQKPNRKKQRRIHSRHSTTSGANRLHEKQGPVEQ